METTREFSYRGKHVRITALRSAAGRYAAVPTIDGERLQVGHQIQDAATLSEALDWGEQLTKKIIDTD